MNIFEICCLLNVFLGVFKCKILLPGQHPATRGDGGLHIQDVNVKFFFFSDEFQL